VARRRLKWSNSAAAAQEFCVQHDLTPDFAESLLQCIQEAANGDVASQSSGALPPSCPTPRTQVFEKLYNEARTRQCRNELAKKRNDLIREQVRIRARALQVAPGSLKCSSWYSSEEPVWDKLHSLAQERKVKTTQAQEELSKTRAAAEMEGVTFKPEIAPSQRRQVGAPRHSTTSRPSSVDSFVRDKECTFRPQICSNSKKLVAFRSARLRITGSAHHNLYDLAMKRCNSQASSPNTSFSRLGAGGAPRSP